MTYAHIQNVWKRSIAVVAAVTLFTALWSFLPGTLPVERVAAASHNMAVTKEAMVGDSSWSSNVNAALGEEVTFRITVDNVGTDAVTNVVVRDPVPDHLNLVSGSAYMVYDGQTTDLSDVFFVSGVKVLDVFPVEGSFTIYYTMQVPDEYTDACGVIDVLNTAYADATEMTERSGRATVTIDTKELCTTSHAVCNLLSVEQLSKTSFKFTVNGDADYPITGYVIRVNGSKVFDSSSAADNSYTWNQTTPGTYTVKGYVKIAKGISEECEDCVKQVTVVATATPTPTPTPGKGAGTTPTLPTSLPSTGSVGTSAMIAGFVTTTVAAAVAHNLFIRRKLGAKS